MDTVTAPGVYAPQDDSRFLVEALEETDLAAGREVLDLCTGSGFVAVAAALLGASSVSAFDICPRAVRCARANAVSTGVDMDVQLRSVQDAVSRRPFDLVLCNPPYVPTLADDDDSLIAAEAGPSQAWSAGTDGRLVLGPLCAALPDLLTDDGVALIIQSEFAGVEQSLAELRSGGLHARVFSRRMVPFGPVMAARSQWLEGGGRLREGRRDEELVVIRADKSALT